MAVLDINLVAAAEDIQSEDGLAIVYDGECPVCSTYVHWLRLKKSAGPVTLIDARESKSVVTTLARHGIDLNEGMAVSHANRIYTGADAVHVLSLLSTGSGPFNTLMAAIFRDSRRADVLYPVMRSGRNLLLKILRRQPIGRSQN